MHDLEVGRAQAVLIVTDYSPERIAAFDRLLRRQVPVAAFSEDCPLEADTVQTDREEGAYLATRHLLGLGHRRIALAVPRDSRAASIRQRIQGFRRAHQEAGVVLHDTLIVPPARAAASFAEGVELVSRVLAHPARPTALFCQNDHVAIGALQALRRTGARVPDDMAVVGFDGIEEGAFTIPPLTIVAQPLTEVARIAVNLLVDRLEQPDEPFPPRHIAVKPALIVRESCGGQPPPAE